MIGLGQHSAKQVSVLLFSAVFFYVTGCSLTAKQRAAVAEFATATVQVAELSAEEVVQIRQDVIDLRQGMLAIGAQSVNPQDPALDLDGPLDLKDAQARLEAIAALKHFGQLLQALIHPSNPQHLRQVGKQFTSALSGIEGIGFSKKQARGLQQLFTLVGRSLTEGMRWRTLRQVVIQTHQPIQRIIHYLRQTFNPEAGLWAAGLKHTVRQIKTTLGKRVKLSDDKGASARKVQYRKLLAEAIRRQRASEQARRQLLKALKALEKAHDALFYAVQSDGVSTPQIDRFFEKARQLVRLYRLIRD